LDLSLADRPFEEFGFESHFGLFTRFLLVV
jgi:hypothetical protein